MRHSRVLVKPWIVAFLLLVGCSSRPITELALADVSLKAAQKARADNLAPDTYRQAENHYLRAKKDYLDGYFESCKENADKARILAEQAEFQALEKNRKLRANPSEANQY